MTSEIKIKVNRANAQKSTGPRTPEGKARVAQNAFRHGLRSRRVILPIENRADFDALAADFHAEWQPATITEHDLVEQLCVNKWKLARMEHVESQACMLSALVHLALKSAPTNATPNLDAKSEKAAAASLNRVSQHIARLERAYFRALTALTRLQDRRLKKLPKQTGYSRPAPEPDPATEQQPEELKIAATATSTAALVTVPILLSRTRLGHSPLPPSGFPDGV